MQPLNGNWRYCRLGKVKLGSFGFGLRLLKRQWVICAKSSSQSHSSFTRSQAPSNHHKTQRFSEIYWSFGSVVICLGGRMELEWDLGVVHAEGTQISYVFFSDGLGWSEIEHSPSWGIKDFMQCPCPSCCVMGHENPAELLVHWFLTYKILQSLMNPLPPCTCRAQWPSPGIDVTAHSLQWDQNTELVFEPPWLLQIQREPAPETSSN